MAQLIDIGVFLPVGNHGWIHSVNSPAVEDGSFARQLEIIKLAEAYNFDFALSPAIWRGRKGPSRHWMDSLESLTVTAALLQATKRIQIFSTIHMTVYPPAIIAKMMGTLDQIAPGRVGLNLVTGSSYLDLAHVGLWNDKLDHDTRYDLGDEWVTVAKRLWTEQVVNHKGDYFELNEATMGPKPSRIPPLVNAGASGRGYKFAADNCDVAFIVASDDPKSISSALNAKKMSKELNKPNLKTYGLVTVIPAETDKEAEDLMAFFNEGADIECLDDIAAGYSQNSSSKSASDASLALTGGAKKSCVMPGEIVGSYETVARRLAKTVTEGQLDGLMLIVPDYVKDLKALSERMLPLMAQFGVITNVHPK